MKNQTGRTGEQYIAEQMTQKGYRIVTMNYHSRYGEIDIVMENDEIIAFVEVKTRSQKGMTAPFEAVTKSKQRRIIRTAEVYLQRNGSQLQPRFDVAAVFTQNEAIIGYDYLENAFQSVERI